MSNSSDQSWSAWALGAAIAGAAICLLRPNRYTPNVSSRRASLAMKTIPDVLETRGRTFVGVARMPSTYAKQLFTLHRLGLDELHSEYPSMRHGGGWLVDTDGSARKSLLNLTRADHGTLPLDGDAGVWEWRTKKWRTDDRRFYMLELQRREPVWWEGDNDGWETIARAKQDARTGKWYPLIVGSISSIEDAED